MLQYPAKLWRGALDELLCERDRPLEMREPLRVCQREEKEGLLPWSGERSVVTVLDPFECEREGSVVVSERARRISVE
jgi:hypothetical protein